MMKKGSETKMVIKIEHNNFIEMSVNVDKK